MNPPGGRSTSRRTPSCAPAPKCVATGQEEGEGAILRYVFWPSIALASLVGVLVLLQAYVFTGMIPGPPPAP